MKYLINERQYNLIKEDKELSFPFVMFNNDWDMVLSVMKGRPFHIQGDLDLYKSKVKSLGSLKSVGGNLYLHNSKILSLGDLEYVGGDLDLYNTKLHSLGNLKSVGGYLYLAHSEVESLGDLEYVGGSLYLRNSPLSEKYSEEEIRQMVDIKDEIKS